MRRPVFLALFLAALAGCAPAPVDDLVDDGGYYVYSFSDRLGIRYLSTRGNVLAQTPRSLLELNAVEVHRRNPRMADFNLPRFGRPPLLPTLPDQYGLWVGHRGVSALGLGEQSTLVVRVDGERFEIPADGEWLVSGLVRGRERRRNYRITTVPPVEVSEEEGEFGLFTFDRVLAQRIRFAREVSVEVVGTEGTFRAPLPAETLGRIQRLFTSRPGYSDRSVDV